MRRILVLCTFLLFYLISKIYAEQYSSPARNFDKGRMIFHMIEESPSGVAISFSIPDFRIAESSVDGEVMHKIFLDGCLSPNQAGAPNLPGYGRYIVVPNGATAKVEIISSEIETIRDLNVAPAPVITPEPDIDKICYEKNADLYRRDVFYPANPVGISDPITIRGIDMIILEVTPFQYNPVTKILRIYRHLSLKVTYQWGNGQFGEERLRSRWWDPVFQRLLLNYKTLPEVKYQKVSTSQNQDFEYVIITPDNPEYISWADSIKLFRTRQGIRTGVVTLTEIGGNTVNDIENYINTAYNTWTIPPVAVLLLADYGTGPATGNGIVSPVYNNYCVSDHIYADVSGNQMVDVVVSRIPAQNSGQLETMVTRFLDYERRPPENSNFYQNPLCVSGWQSTGTYVLSAEVIEGFWENILGKQPARQYAGYSGGVPSAWPNDPYSMSIVAMFGPSGLGYIPATPSYLTNWTGSAAGINTAINSGAFAVHYRGSGSETGWGEPAYSISDLSGLNEARPAFIFSFTSLTGKFNYGSDCFAEAIYKNPGGALGVIAASEITYAFVTDSYVWGLYDYLRTEFFPGLPSTPAHAGIMPAFANVAGKYYLYQDNWPFNPNSKELTYHLFHHFGEAFSSLYTQMPQYLTVLHDSVLASGQDYFTVSADSGALISLTVNGEIIGVDIGTGAPVDLGISQQTAGDTMYVTVTKPNYYRYSKRVLIVDPNLVNKHSDITPGDFQLYQNFPNPFNPITNIGFQIADFGFVSLKVYDVTGREVATVLSEKLAVGKYEVNWNASGLGSGVYLYQLQVGKYTQTRKLILLR